MGRRATVAAGNVWYEARMNASKWNEKLLSREGTAELLNMSVDSLKDTEMNLLKHMPVDKAVLMADLYNAPELLNYYCIHECPIGCRRCISDEVHSIDRVTVKLLKNLKVNELSEMKDKLLDIAEDGMITEDEKPDLREVVEYLDKISVTISELKILSEKVLRGGQVNG